MRVPRYFATLVAILLTCISSVPVFAATQAVPSGASNAIYVAVVSTGDSSLVAVITEVLTYGLERDGLETTIAAGAGEQTADSELLSAASASKAPVAIVCRYSSNGTSIDLSLSWYDVSQGKALASTTKSGAVDLQLDTAILQALDALLSQVGDTVKQLAQSSAEPAPQSTERSPQAAVTANQTATQTAATPEAPQPAASEGPANTAASSEQSATPASTEPPTAGPRFYLSLGFSPFITLGEAAQYFTLGYRAPIVASYLFSTPAGRLGIGVFADVTYFVAKGIVETAQSFLVPLGPDLRYELPVGTMLSFELHLGGGPALLVLSTPPQGMQTELLAFALCGLSGEFLITPGFGIELGADFETFFEKSLTVMGISPSLSVTLRL